MTEATISRPRIDPRIARRWVEVQRANGRRRLRIIVCSVSAAVIVAFAAGSVYTPLWKVRHVRVKVSGAISAAKVEQLAGLGRHRLMIDVDPARLAARLDAVPYLGGAAVSRVWPGTVTIRVAVRTPVALISRGNAGWATVDPTGRILAYLTNPIVGMPILQGLPDLPARGQWLAGSLGPSTLPGTSPSAEVDMNAGSGSTDVPTLVESALIALQSLPASVRPEILDISVSGPAGLTMAVLPADVAAGSITVKLGDGSLLSQKLEAMLTLLAQADLSNVSEIDLTVPDRPAVLTAQ